jgi:nucleotide-binding universal stress UspA family protein
LGTRILVPYDGSESSDKAVLYTIQYAKSLSKDAEIILMYVVPEIQLPPSYEYGMRISYVKSSKEYRKEVYQQLRNRGLDMLERKRDEFKEAGLRNVGTRVSVGNTAKEIIGLASAEKVGLIVIGSQGLGGISKLKALGSVSRSVSERAKCPVLVVH